MVYMARKKRRKEKKEERKRIEREAEEMGVEPPPKQIPATLENTRVPDDTIVRVADKEVLEDEATDEFHEYFTRGKVVSSLNSHLAGFRYHLCNSCTWTGTANHDYDKAKTK